MRCRRSAAAESARVDISVCSGIKTLRYWCCGVCDAVLSIILKNREGDFREESKFAGNTLTKLWTREVKRTPMHLSENGVGNFTGEFPYCYFNVHRGRMITSSNSRHQSS